MKFLLNTDTVSDTATSVNKTAQEVQSIMDSCNGYSVDNSDGFDFAGAKKVIVSNLSNCAARMGTTASIISSVVSEHTSLQSSLSFEKFLNPEPEKTADDAAAPINGSPGSSSGGSRRSGGRSSGRSSGAPAALASGILTETQVETEKPVEQQIVETQSVTEVKKVGYAVIDEKGLTEESKKVLKDSEGKDNLIMIGDRYVIACDSSYAKVGDVIRYTGKDGKVVECVVGINTVTKANKNSVYLLAENNQFTSVDSSKMITESSTKVENLGNYTQISSATGVPSGISGQVPATEGNAAPTQAAQNVNATEQTTPSTSETNNSSTVEQATPSTTETNNASTEQQTETTTVDNSDSTNKIDELAKEGGSVNA